MKLNENEIKSAGTNLACDLFEEIGLKFTIKENLRFCLEVVDRMSQDTTLNDLEKVLQVAIETIDEIETE